MLGSAANHTIRLLHLSDIHFRAGKNWDADPVLRDLTRIIADDVSEGLVACPISPGHDCGNLNSSGVSWWMGQSTRVNPGSGS